MFSVWKNISIFLFLHCGVTVATLWSEIWVNISFSFILKAETLPCKPLCCCYVCLKCVKTRVLEINYLNSVSVPRKWEWCSGRSVARSHRCHWSLSHDETLSAVSCWDNVTSWTFPKLQHGRCVCVVATGERVSIDWTKKSFMVSSILGLKQVRDLWPLCVSLRWTRCRRLSSTTPLALPWYLKRNRSSPVLSASWGSTLM